MARRENGMKKDTMKRVINCNRVKFLKVNEGQGFTAINYETKRKQMKHNIVSNG